MNQQGKRIAIVPGSFDPITYGHIDLVKRAAAEYDKVYLAVMINREKQYLFSLEQRKQIATIALEHFDNVEVISSEGMLWKLAQDLNACAIVKGFRNQSDLEYEKKMAEFNHAHNPNAETVLLEAKKDLLCVSSTVVRQRIAEGKDLSEFMPRNVEMLVRQFLTET